MLFHFRKGVHCLRYCIWMKQISILSGHESCCNLLIEGSTKKLQSFLYKDELVNFHKNATVNKSDKYLRAILLLSINIRLY